MSGTSPLTYRITSQPDVWNGAQLMINDMHGFPRQTRGPLLASDIPCILLLHMGYIRAWFSPSKTYQPPVQLLRHIHMQTYPPTYTNKIQTQTSTQPVVPAPSVWTDHSGAPSMPAGAPIRRRRPAHGNDIYRPPGEPQLCRPPPGEPECLYQPTRACRFRLASPSLRSPVGLSSRCSLCRM